MFRSLLGIVLLLSLVSTPALAAFSIGTISYSYHYTRTEGQNERHKGIYIKYNRWLIGNYLNTQYVRSNVITYDLIEFVKRKNTEAVFVVGIADGYDSPTNIFKPFFPVIGIKLRYSILTLTITPSVAISGLEFTF